MISGGMHSDFVRVLIFKWSSDFYFIYLFLMLNLKEGWIALFLKKVSNF